MQSPGKRAAAACVLLAACAVGGVQYYRSYFVGRQREMSGRIVAIDLAARAARFEFTHPRSGEKIVLSGVVPPECKIDIDGRAAALEELRVGDDATVTGTIYRDGTTRPNFVRVRHLTTNPVSGAGGG